MSALATLQQARPAQQFVIVQPNRLNGFLGPRVFVTTPPAAAATQWRPCVRVNIAPNQIGAEAQQNVAFTTPRGAVASLEDERFEVKETSTPVTVNCNGYYNRSNHYIHHSREYVGGAKLTRYINFPALGVLSVITMVASLVSPAYFIFAFIMAGFDLVWFLVFVQHLYVNVGTMPQMLRLPRVPDHTMRAENGFCEISQEKYHAVFGVQAESGIGIIVAAKGTIKLHVLTHKAVNYMRKAMVYSTIALITFFLLVMYCISFGIIGLVATLR